MKPTYLSQVVPASVPVTLQLQGRQPMEKL